MKLSYDNPWVKLNPDGSNPLQTCWSGVKFEYLNLLTEKLVRNFNAIEVGDFVKCKSRSNDWRKILEIDERHMTITGRGAWEPNNENLKDTMSTNGIITITKIVKG